MSPSIHHFPTACSPGRPVRDERPFCTMLRRLPDTRLHLAVVLTLSMTFVPRAGVCGVPDGAAIYRSGRLADGKPLTARRAGSGQITGAEAACASCHRRSGLGAREGRISIPPIAGRYLFRSIGKESDDLDVPFVEDVRLGRASYTNET